MRRIIGIDPGSRYTGYGIVDTDGRNSQHVVSGRIRTGKEEFCTRLGMIYQGIEEIIAEYHPLEAAVEQVFMARNPNSALKLGQARGAAISALVVAKLPVAEYTPRLVKQAVVGTGTAEKGQVGHMVRVMLNINQPLTEDQGDALAVALCHAHMSETTQRLKRGVSW